MKIPQTKEDLENLIINKVEENLNLEYKDGRALNDVKEIAKDVSAFANAAGGVIIYGIKEFDEANKKHLPEKITPIDRKSFSKEWLEQVINSNISPKIEGLKIDPISLDSDNEVAYVINIPQGSTAHQNTKDYRYYKRHNFKSEPMLDYEIRDILNRAKHPLIELHFEIEKSSGVLSGDGFTVTLRARPFNKGNIYARFVNYFIELPDGINLHPNLVKISEGVVEFYGENTFRDLVDIRPTLDSGIPIYGPSRFDPILPKAYGKSERILLVGNFIPSDKDVIRWRVHADNAPVQEGSILLKEIPIVEKNESN